jgi:hypothetical protein
MHMNGNTHMVYPGGTEWPETNSAQTYSLVTVITTSPLPEHYSINNTEHPTKTVAGWWFQTWFVFPFHIWDVILPIDFHMFHDG